VYCIPEMDWPSTPILFQMAIRCTQCAFRESSYSILDTFWHDPVEYRYSRVRVKCLLRLFSPHMSERVTKA
jgi:hypothetical protein